MRRWIEAGLIAATLAAGVILPGHVNTRQAADLGRPVEEYRIVPVRVHLLRAPQMEAIGTKLKSEDITRIFRKANGIWHQAGIHLWVESIVDEKPANTKGHEEDTVLPLDALGPLRPKETLGEGMFHVYYIGNTAVNGIFMGRDSIFVKETAKLRVVEGGIDEPLPRVTAHELGHGMGLPHRQAMTNLMASGTTGTSLNAEEIEKVRRKLDGFKWVLPAEDFLKKTDEMVKENHLHEAEGRYQALLDIPGASPLKEQAKVGLEKTKKP
jgi:hypothetical protein